MSVVGPVGYTVDVVVSAGVVSHMVEGREVVGYSKMEKCIPSRTEITATLSSFVASYCI